MVPKYSLEAFGPDRCALPAAQGVDRRGGIAAAPSYPPTASVSLSQGCRLPSAGGCGPLLRAGATRRAPAYGRLTRCSTSAVGEYFYWKKERNALHGDRVRGALSFGLTTYTFSGNIVAEDMTVESLRRDPGLHKQASIPRFGCLSEDQPLKSSAERTFMYGRSCACPNKPPYLSYLVVKGHARQ